MTKGKPSKGTAADRRLVSHKSKADQRASAAKRSTSKKK